MSIFVFIYFTLSVSKKNVQIIKRKCITKYRHTRDRLFGLVPLCTRPTRLVEFIIVPAHWNNSPWIDRHVAPLGCTLSWFRANQSLVFLLNAVCLVEKQHIQIFIVFGLTRSWLELTVCRTRGQHANHYTIDADQIPLWFMLLIF